LEKVINYAKNADIIAKNTRIALTAGHLKTLYQSGSWL
jgi:hypothetical protein